MTRTSHSDGFNPTYVVNKYKFDRLLLPIGRSLYDVVLCGVGWLDTCYSVNADALSFVYR